MGKVMDALDDKLTEWIGAQHVFFVASAPLEGGHVNVSPKGHDTLRVLGPSSVAYLDLTGSGAETIAHTRENGRITIMFCSFEGPPLVLRPLGPVRNHVIGSPDAAALPPRFPALSASPAFIPLAIPPCPPASAHST